MQVWKYQYGENTIEIRNWDVGGCELHVNGQMQDKKTGISFKRRTLTGRLDSGEEIKATPGGPIASPTLFVDEKLIRYSG